VDFPRGSDGPARWASRNGGPDVGADLNGAIVALRQRDQFDKETVQDHDTKQFWKYDNGDMYLGPRKWDDELQIPVEHGFGVLYNCVLGKFSGKIFIGNWKLGQCHRIGKTFWLQSAKSWTENHCPGSEIRTKKEKGIGRGLPFGYIGRFVEDCKSDPSATVWLKDGTTRNGPWDEGDPVGDWWTDHKIVAASVVGHRASDDRRSQAGQESKEQPKRQQRQSTNEVKLVSRPAADKSLPTVAQSFIGEPADRKPLPTFKLDQIKPKTAKRKMEDEDVEIISPPSVARLPPPVQSSSSKIKLDADLAITKNKLQEWLKAEALGPRVLASDLKYYADKFIEEGLESKDAIVSYCSQKDVEGFVWMKKFHMKAFLANVELRTE